MAEFILLGGLPGSGKSTLGAQLNLEFGVYVVSTDRLRKALNAGVYPRNVDGRYTVLNDLVMSLARKAVLDLIARGHSVALDATNLTSAGRADWIAAVRSAAPGARIVIHWCKGNWDSPKRWADERGYSIEEYECVLQQLKAIIELPQAGEADELYFHVDGRVVLPVPRCRLSRSNR